MWRNEKNAAATLRMASPPPVSGDHCNHGPSRPARLGRPRQWQGVPLPPGGLAGFCSIIKPCAPCALATAPAARTVCVCGPVRGVCMAGRSVLGLAASLLLRSSYAVAVAHLPDLCGSWFPGCCSCRSPSDGAVSVLCSVCVCLCSWSVCVRLCGVCLCSVCPAVAAV